METKYINKYRSGGRGLGLDNSKSGPKQNYTLGDEKTVRKVELGWVVPTAHLVIMNKPTLS